MFSFILSENSLKLLTHNFFQDTMLHRGINLHCRLVEEVSLVAFRRHCGKFIRKCASLCDDGVRVYVQHTGFKF